MEENSNVENSLEFDLNENDLNSKQDNKLDNFSNLKNEKSNKFKKFYIFLILFFLIIVGIFFVLDKIDNKEDNNKEIDSVPKKSSYRISSNSLEPFDLYFLQLENKKENKIYSPLSIKYALAMLEEGTDGESKTQISNVLGDYLAKKYINSKNMSFANALFVNDLYKNSINDSYVNLLTQKYNAEVCFDSFKTPTVVNSWVNDKTLGLINNLFDDISEEQFLLINALGIDMDWEETFFEKSRNGYSINTNYMHEKFWWYIDAFVNPEDFNDYDQKVSGMKFAASFNNYDIVKELGEDVIRETVRNAFVEYLNGNDYDKLSNYFYNEDITGLSDDELMEKYLDRYIDEIASNYKREDVSTDFSFYVDDNVKVFAKNLKDYDETTLQYVGIMPTNEELDSYISDITVSEINNFIDNLKLLKLDSFKDGVVTKITGVIPKFKFEYNLDLMNDLKKLGITNVFESGKANLINVSSDSTLYIDTAVHRANIEFTQDGIKASAATIFGGSGAGGMFDYNFDIPVEEIDLTFDKPYMFLIRDINSGEVWFTGTVYNPLVYLEDDTRNFNLLP